jgi:hypothetical protein
MEKDQALTQCDNTEQLPVQVIKPDHSKLPGYISWDQRSSGVYGIYCKDCYQAKTSDGKSGRFHHTEYLGKVIDRNAGIFSNRKRGIFKFTLENGFEEVANPEFYVLTKPPEVNLQFGGTWVLDEILKQFGLKQVIDSLSIDDVEKDTLYSLVSFKTFAKDWPYKMTNDWYFADYSSILYPKAVLYSQSIGRFLKKIGREEIFREFFREYLKIVRQFQHNNLSSKQEDDSFSPLLIDSTGLINYINTPITAPCSHGGPATTQIRLIYIVDHSTSLPIYFRYVPGNVVDKTTLIPTIKILKSYNLDIKMLIMDAGYYSKDNIEDMLSQNLPFVLRMPENNTIYASVLNDYAEKLDDTDNLVSYNKRFLFVEQVKLSISGKECYAYLCLDLDKEKKDKVKFIQNNYDNDDFKDKYKKKSINFGKFMILSNKNINKSKIIDTYYSRAKIEQIFDTAKNMTGLLPLGVHSEEALSGHLLISFISSVVYSIIYNKLSDKKIFSTDFYYQLQLLRIDIYANNNHIIHELCKDQREVIEALDLEYPFQVKVGNQRKANAILDRKSKGKRGRPKDSKGKPKYKHVHETVATTDTLAQDAEAKGTVGRPPGSKNKPKPVKTDTSTAGTKPKSRLGRPHGSKNKPKPAKTDTSTAGTKPKSRLGRPQ